MRSRPSLSIFGFFIRFRMESSLRASCGFQGRPLDRQYRTRKANEDLGFYEEFVGPIFDELAISMDILFDQDGWLVPLRELVRDVSLP